MIVAFCLFVLLLFPYTDADALSINIAGIKLSKAYVIFTEDEVISRYVDFMSREVAKTFNIKFEKKSIKSSKHFIVIGNKQVNVPFMTGINGSGIKDDGFLLQIEPGNIVIYSKEPLALIYGVCEFMELLGFRYYMPGPYGTVYPASDIYLSKLKIISNPAFKYRSIGNSDWSLFAYRANVNIDTLPENYGRRIFGIFHTFDLLLPEEKYFHEHPEYYAKRKLWDLFNKKGKLQLNTANPAVIELIAGNLADLSKKGNYEMLTLAPNDHRRFDMSFKSLKMDEWGVPSDQKMSKRILIFYNKVAKRYKEKGGALPVRIGAYDAYTAPPRNEMLKLESGLIPYVAHFDYCQLHAIEDKNCKPNKRFSEIIERWSNLSQSLFIYEYAYKHNWLELPWPVYIHTVQNIKYYKDKGAVGYFTQFSKENTFSNLLNYYISAKAFWNPEVDYKKIRNEFFALFYKGVSGKMEKCYRLLENEFFYAKIDTSRDARKNFRRIYKKDNLKNALSIAENAYVQANDPMVKARVDMMLIWLKYSLSMWLIIEGKDVEQNTRLIAALIKESENKGYPIFNEKILFKPWYLGRVVKLDNFLNLYNSFK